MVNHQALLSSSRLLLQKPGDVAEKLTVHNFLFFLQIQRIALYQIFTDMFLQTHQSDLRSHYKTSLMLYVQQNFLSANEIYESVYED